MSTKYKVLTLSLMLSFAAMSKGAFAISATTKEVIRGHGPEITELAKQRLGLSVDNVHYDKNDLVDNKLKVEAITSPLNVFVVSGDFPNTEEYITDLDGDISYLDEDGNKVFAGTIDTTDLNIVWKDANGLDLPKEALSKSLCDIRSESYIFPLKASVTANLVAKTTHGLPNTGGAVPVTNEYDISEPSDSECAAQKFGIVKYLAPLDIKSAASRLDKDFVANKGFTVSSGFPKTGFPKAAFKIVTEGESTGLTYESTNPTLAQVDDNGLVTLSKLDGAAGDSMKNRGAATINVKSEGKIVGSYSFKIDKWYDVNRDRGDSQLGCGHQAQGARLSCQDSCMVLADALGEEMSYPGYAAYTFQAPSTGGGGRLVGSIFSEWGEVSTYGRKGTINYYKSGTYLTRDLFGKSVYGVVSGTGSVLMSPQSSALGYAFCQVR